MLKKLSLILLLSLFLTACGNSLEESELLGNWRCVQLTTAKQVEYNLQKLETNGINWILTFQAGGIGFTQSGTQEKDPITWKLQDNVLEVTDSLGEIYKFEYKDGLLYLQMDGNSYVMALEGSSAYQDFLNTP